MGFFASKTLLSAVELGVFNTLGGGPMSGESLRQRLGLHPRSAADFLDALVALGFLAREGDGAAASYANSPDTAAFLDPASPSYLGGILLMATSRLLKKVPLPSAAFKSRVVAIVEFNLASDRIRPCLFCPAFAGDFIAFVGADEFEAYVSLFSVEGAVERC